MFDKIIMGKDIMILDTVYKRAKEIMVRIQGHLSRRNPATVVAICLKLALDELMPQNSKPIFSYICSILKVSELSVKNFIKILKEGRSTRRVTSFPLPPKVKTLIHIDP